MGGAREGARRGQPRADTPAARAEIDRVVAEESSSSSRLDATISETETMMALEVSNAKAMSRRRSEGESSSASSADGGASATAPKKKKPKKRTATTTTTTTKSKARAKSKSKSKSKSRLSPSPSPSRRTVSPSPTRDPAPACDADDTADERRGRSSTPWERLSRASRTEGEYYFVPGKAPVFVKPARRGRSGSPANDARSWSPSRSAEEVEKAMRRVVVAAQPRTISKTTGGAPAPAPAAATPTPPRDAFKASPRLSSTPSLTAMRVVAQPRASKPKPTVAAPTPTPGAAALRRIECGTATIASNEPRRTPPATPNRVAPPPRSSASTTTPTSSSCESSPKASPSRPQAASPRPPRPWIGGCKAREKAAAKRLEMNPDDPVALKAAAAAAARAEKAPTAPPPELRNMFRRGEWETVRGKPWSVMTPGQMRDKIEREAREEVAKKVNEYSRTLKAKKEKTKELTPTMAYGNMTPLNAAEERRAFLAAWDAYKKGERDSLPRDPQFVYADEEAARLRMSEWGAPRDDLLDHATRIMNAKRERYGDEGSYEKAAWGGDTIGVSDLEDTIKEYLIDHGIEKNVTIEWHDSLATPSMTMSLGRRKAHGVLHMPSKASTGGFFRREWIQALLDHEIGTHFACAINDAHASEYVRGTFNTASHWALRGRNVTPREHLVTEEGLATLNTHMSAKVKLLWGPALAYWTRWMGTQLGFSSLFEALEPYVPELSRRWQQCYRCKRGLSDTSEKKSLAKDQCYLEGAWRLLEGRKHLDFKLLHSGRIALEEYPDAKSAWLRFTHASVSKGVFTMTPHFLREPGKYAAHLEEIAVENGVEAKADPLARVKRSTYT